MRTILSLLCMLILLSCTKAESTGDKDAGPSNLVITSTIATDGSGKVDFKATAKNAVTYQFDFGNGVSQPAPTGETSYTYSVVGSINYIVTVKATAANGQSISKSVQITVTVENHVPGLVWSDEFDKDGAPDPNKWTHEIGNGSNGWGNQELEYYTNRRENSIVQNGKLKIIAFKESYQGFNYTSARLVSKGKFEMKYGKVEFSAKLPEGVGTWPALWMLGSNISTVGWPACGEIDIMEHLGRDLNNIYATLHYPGRSGSNADGKTRKILNATTEFHKYTLDWSATAISMYVDDQLIHTVPNTLALPFNQDFFFIMNLAIGGNFAGAVDPALTGAVMEVDYVRVYK